MRELILSRIEFYKTQTYFRWKVWGNLGVWPEDFDFSKLSDSELISAFETIVKTINITDH